MRRLTNKSGYTLMELMVSLVILGMATTLSISGYLLLLKKSNNLGTQLELDMDAQNAIERLKIDLRLSSMNEIYGYPADDPPYEALCFPIASIDPDTGMLPRDPDTLKIIWDRTVVYHVVEGSPDQLRRTSFDYDVDLTDAERQAVLNYIVQQGGAAGLSGIENLESTVIFNNLLNWELKPEGGWISTYSETPGYATISLGYALLQDTENVLEFTAKDSVSSYKLGIDQIMANSSLNYREAELALASRVEFSGGDTPQEQSKAAYGNRHALYYDAKAEGSTLSITIPNDVWELTDFENFSGSGYMERDRTVIKTDYTLDDIVVALEGNETSWMAESQTADFDAFDSTSNLVGATVSILLKGSGVAGGNMINSDGERCKLTFRAAEDSNLHISQIMIGESASSNTTAMAFGSSPETVYFSGSDTVTVPVDQTRTSDWVDLPISKDKNYLVTFQIDHANKLHMWGDYRAYNLSLPTTTRIKNAAGTEFGAYILPALESLFVSYADEGTYTSDIMDTCIDSPLYENFSWLVEFANGSCSFKVRSGNEPDLTDAPAFSSLTAWNATVSESSQIIGSQTGRYIQFQAILNSSTDYLESPLLRKVEINWDGESRMVNMSGKFTTGPDYGDFYVTLNGSALKSAVQVDMEIYEDITMGVNGETQRISSSIKADITPRNSGL